MYDYDIAIIGSGLGGLVCGAILAMNGYKVGIFEKNRQIGGCLQTFSRDKVIIDTGVHYIGGLGEGQTLNRIFKYLGIRDELRVKKMDDIFDIICFEGDEKEYKLAQGYENFIRQLLIDFPGEEEALRQYCDKMKEVCAKFPLYNLRMGDYSEKEEVIHIDTWSFLRSITSNEKLRQVLAGNNLLYAGVADKTPFYVHALITNSFIESAWKCVGGGGQIAKLLGKRIREHGGDIFRSSKVVRIAGDQEKLGYIELEDGKRVTARYFISNLHPTQTMRITNSEVIRNAYRSRIEMLENTEGTFLMNIVLKKDTFPYLNHNYYYHKTENVWQGPDYTEENWPLTYALLVSSSAMQEQYADNLSIMTYMRYEDVEKWNKTFNTDTHMEDRGSDYEAFKKEKAERLLDVVEQKFPNIRACIRSYYVATPLTYRDYLGTADGSMYGIAKDHHNSTKTFIAPRTRLPNLFLTGQNLNLHGVLGVTISALITCGVLIDLNTLLEKINGR